MHPKLKTRLCDLLGIEAPVIQGGMVHVSTWPLASAAANAGALGVLGTGNWPPEEVERQIRGLRDQLEPGRAWAVNLLLLSPYAKDNMEVCLREKVPAVTFGAGIPRREIPIFKEAGIRCLPLAGSPRMAALMEKVGADAVICEGMESGGEIGDMTTMTLVPMCADAVDIPVVAAGGIADGRGLVAALALGADGVQMGTRFLMTQECPAHANAKQLILESRDRGTMVAGEALGNPIRSIANPMSKEFKRKEIELLKTLDPSDKGSLMTVLVEYGVGATRRGLLDGDVDKGSVLAGQISGMISDIPTCKQLITRMMSEAEAALARLS